MNIDKKELDAFLSDTVIEKPHGFMVGDRHFFLYPVTLGKIHVLQPLVEALEINREYLMANVHAEALRLAGEKREVCLNIIYVHTCKTKDEIFDPVMSSERMAFFSGEMSVSDIATLLILVLTGDRTDMFMKHLGIEKEQEDMRRVMEEKKKHDRNNYTFGGRSLYGSFIAPLMEMGFSWDEILWQRSHANLRLILADKMNSVYVSDEERSHLNITSDRERVDGDDKKAVWDAINSESWD